MAGWIVYHHFLFLFDSGIRNRDCRKKCPGIRAVSYTHLDVYKRQINTNANANELHILPGIPDIMLPSTARLAAERTPECSILNKRPWVSPKAISLPKPGMSEPDSAVIRHRMIDKIKELIMINQRYGLEMCIRDRSYAV